MHWKSMPTDEFTQATSKATVPKKRRIWRWLDLTLLLLVVAVAAFIWWLLPGRHDVAQDVQLPARYADGDALIASSGGLPVLVDSCLYRLHGQVVCSPAISPNLGRNGS